MNYIFKNKHTGKYFNFDKWINNQNLPNAPSKTDVDNLEDATIYSNEFANHGDWLLTNNYPYEKLTYEQEQKNIRKLKIRNIEM